MKTSLLLETDAWVIAFFLLVIMISSTMLGVKLGKARKKLLLKNNPDGKFGDTNYLAGLFFFLLAFTFGMSASRFDARRVVVVNEANNIGTAILRSDLYKPEERMLFRKDFLEYVEARIDYYEAGTNIEKIMEAESRMQKISQKLWMRAMKLSEDPANIHATLLMVSSLNDLIDIDTTRLSAEKAKVPESILWMLFALACINAFFSGYSAVLKGTLDWLVEVGFCVLISLVILFTFDLDRPRRGFVTLDASNQTIVDLRNYFK